MMTKNDKPLESTHPMSEAAEPDAKPERSGAEEAWPMDIQEETENLDQLKQMELDLVTDQLEKFGALDPKSAARGYASLIQNNPGHTDQENWKKRLDDWTSKIG